MSCTKNHIFAYLAGGYSTILHSDLLLIASHKS